MCSKISQEFIHVIPNYTENFAYSSKLREHKPFPKVEDTRVRKQTPNQNKTTNLSRKQRQRQGVN